MMILPGYNCTPGSTVRAVHSSARRMASSSGYGAKATVTIARMGLLLGLTVFYDLSQQTHVLSVGDPAAGRG